MENFENILSNQNDYMFQCDRKALKSSFYFQHRNLACFDVGSKLPVHLPFKGAFTYPSQKISNKKQYDLQITNSLDSISGINQLEEHFWKILGIFQKNKLIFPVTCLHSSEEESSQIGLLHGPTAVMSQMLLSTTSAISGVCKN